ncbi:MAG: TolC family protein, partial [Kiritimatiellaeota bacterium]|nr:TolC family protein [Kiritimatiellota bacterium]
MKTFLCVSFAGLLLVGVSHAQPSPAEPEGPLTLEQALALVAARHPELELGRLDVAAAAARKQQAGLWANPTLAAEAENFGGSGERTGTALTEYTVQIEQPLELGGKRSRRLHVAECEQRLTIFDLAAKQLDAQAETQRRFAALLAAQARVQLEGEFLALTEEFCRAAGLRVRAGRVSPLEESRAQIELARQRVAQQQAAAALATARGQLAALWNSSAPRFTLVTGELTALPDLPALEKLQAALPQNPDLARWATEVEQRRASLALAKAGRIPDVTAAAGVRWFNEDSGYAFVAGLSVPLPLFDRNQGALREASVLLLKAEREQHAAEVHAQTALVSAHQTLASARTKALALKDEILPRAAQVLEATRAGY